MTDVWNAAGALGRRWSRTSHLVRQLAHTESEHHLDRPCDARIQRNQPDDCKNSYTRAHATPTSLGCTRGSNLSSASTPEILNRASLEWARTLVITVSDDPVAETIVAAARRSAPSIHGGATVTCNSPAVR